MDKEDNKSGKRREENEERKRRKENKGRQGQLMMNLKKISPQRKKNVR